MGIGRETLIVFSLASILVLAGFSIILDDKAAAGGNAVNGPNAGNGPIAPPFGDFVCWTAFESPISLTSDIQILDQFGPVEHTNSWQQIQYCTAASKFIDPEIFESPFSPLLNQHYQGWHYDEAFSEGIGQPVLIQVPQFDDFQTVLGPLEQIMVPAIKILDFDPFEVVSVDLEQHWNCYEIDGLPPDVGLIDLFTQHGEIVDVSVGNPFLFCTPMIKIDSTQQVFPFDEILIDEHMVCYFISVNPRNDGTENLPFALFDQLTQPFQEPAPIDNLFLEKLCVPAFKSFPTVGGSMVPIDTTALLLAGVQSISMWMIPVVLAGIGIGVFVVIRRK